MKDAATIIAAGLNTESPDSPLVIREVLAGEARSLSQAARLMPPQRGGKPCNPSTVWRWATTGSRGPDGKIVKLEVARVGCRWITSAPALMRFITALTGATNDPQPPPSKPAAKARRQRQVADAQAELTKLGI